MLEAIRDQLLQTLKGINDIKDVKDLIRLAEKYQYLDPLIEKNVIFVKWDEEWAIKIIEKFSYFFIVMKRIILNEWKFFKINRKISREVYHFKK